MDRNTGGLGRDRTGGSSERTKTGVLARARHALLSTVLTAGVFAVASPALADDGYWQVYTGTWENAANWDPGPPGTADNAIIDDSYGTTPNVSLSTAQTVGSLLLGAGTLTIQSTGSVTSTLGANIQGGTLMLNGSLTTLTSSVYVGGNGLTATLGGTGSITLNRSFGSVEFDSQAVAAPGAAGQVGTLTVNGSTGHPEYGQVQFNSGSTYQAHLGVNGVSDLITASGAITINGANLSILPVSGVSYSTGWQYTILHGASITGTFANLPQNGSITGSFATLTGSYSATDLTLTITAAVNSDTHWQTTTGNWEPTTNWDNGLPNTSGAAYINDPNANVSLSTAQSIRTLNLQSGTLTIQPTGSLTATEDVNVQGGTLMLNGSLATSGTGGVYVGGNGVAATLGGTGTITLSSSGSSVAFNAQGVAAPGAAGQVGTLTVSGSAGHPEYGRVSFTNGSTYQVHLGANGVSDLINASGEIKILTGANLSVLPISGVSYATGWQYTILHGASITGTFANLPHNGSITGSFAKLTGAYSTTDLTLRITAVIGGGGGTGGGPGTGSVNFASKAVTPNQTATATALSTVSNRSAVYNAVFLSPNDTSTRNTFDQISGSAHASTQSALIQDSHFVRDAINDRIRSAFDGVAAPSMAVTSYAEQASAQQGPFAAYAKAPAKAPSGAFAPESFAVWASGFGSWGKTNSDGNAAQIDRRTSGFLIGADSAVFDSWRVGILAGYSISHFDTVNSSGDSDNYHVGGYAGTQWGALAFRSGLAYTQHSITTKRSVQAALLGGGAFADSLSANYNAETVQAFGEFGYRFDVAATALEPFVNLAHVRFTNDGFTESGGDAALSVRSGTTATTFTTLGTRASSKFDFIDFETTARGSLGWRHAFGDIDPRSTNAFSTGDAFTVAGAPIDKNAAVVEAGLDFRISPTAVLGVSYNGQFGTALSENGATAHLKVNF